LADWSSLGDRMTTSFSPASFEIFSGVCSIWTPSRWDKPRCVIGPFLLTAPLLAGASTV
jgi:hypothetical protein